MSSFKCAANLLTHRRSDMRRLLHAKTRLIQVLVPTSSCHLTRSPLPFQQLSCIGSNQWLYFKCEHKLDQLQTFLPVISSIVLRNVVLQTIPSHQFNLERYWIADKPFDRETSTLGSPRRWQGSGHPWWFFSLFISASMEGEHLLRFLLYSRRERESNLDSVMVWEVVTMSSMYK